MRSSLALRLQTLGYDDRTIMRTIALWRATNSVEIMRLLYMMCAAKPDFMPPIERLGVCE